MMLGTTSQTHHLQWSGAATLRCCPGNGAVLSAGDNVPTAVVLTGWGLAEPPMGNQNKPLINLVSFKWRKALKRHAKRQATRGWRFYLAIPPLVVRPGKWGSLKGALNVDPTAPVKPDGPRRWQDLTRDGIPTAMEGDGPAGRGWQKKRMPGCNGPDRAGARVPEILNLKGCRLLPGPN